MLLSGNLTTLSVITNGSSLKPLVRLFSRFDRIQHLNWSNHNERMPVQDSSADSDISKLYRLLSQRLQETLVSIRLRGFFSFYPKFFFRWLSNKQRLTHVALDCSILIFVVKTSRQEFTDILPRSIEKITLHANGPRDKELDIDYLLETLYQRDFPALKRIDLDLESPLADKDLSVERRLQKFSDILHKAGLKVIAGPYLNELRRYRLQDSFNRDPQDYEISQTPDIMYSLTSYQHETISGLCKHGQIVRSGDGDWQETVPQCSPDECIQEGFWIDFHPMIWKKGLITFKVINRFTS